MARKRKSKKEGKKLTTQQLIIIVVVVVIIIITVGWFLWNKQRKEQKEIEKENKKKRLEEVEKRVEELEKNKKEIEETERQIFIRARLFVGALLAAGNVIYCVYLGKETDLGKITDFNGAILLGYSFIAFITYGTPKNFVANIKQRASVYLRSEHIDSLTELEILQKEREILIAEIKALDNPDSNDNSIS